MATNHAFIAYDAVKMTYTIQPGASTSDIQSLLNSADKGTTFLFAAGTHKITNTLKVDTDNITIKGAGEGKTTLLFDMSPNYGIHVQGSDGSYNGKLTSDASRGDNTITLQNTSGLKAGDFLKVEQANTDSWLKANGYSNVVGTSYQDKLPLNETLVEIKSISGNTVTLKTPITHDMDSSVTTVRTMNLLKDVHLSDFSINYNLGTPNPDHFGNEEPQWQGKISVFIEKTVDADVQNVSIINAPSHSMEFRTALSPNVNNYLADGSHNKGDTGDGYGIQATETYYGTFTNLDLLNNRHAFVFSAWHTEVGNTVHIKTTNRDINFHGSPDYDNKVVVESDLYRSGDTIWRIVSPGGSKHPFTDIYGDNTILFGVARAGEKQDVIYGWDQGAWLDGGKGNDTLYGGAGNDIIMAGAGYDEIHLGAGKDIVAFRPGEGSDDIYGFGADDKLVIDNFSGVSSFGNVQISGSSDATITVGGQRLAVLHDYSASKLTASNFIFNDDSYFSPPAPPDYEPGPDPNPNPDPDPNPGPDPEPNPDPEPQPQPGDGITVSANSKTETITGSAKADTVEGYTSQINTADTINLGAGYDTLKFRSGSATFDTKLYQKLSGVDHLDMTVPNDRAKVILDKSFLDRTDNGELTISFGSAKGVVDTSGLKSGEYKIAWQGNTAKVTLVEPTPNPDPDPNPNPDPNPDPNPNPDPVPTPVEGQVFSATSRTETINGTANDDTVKGYSSQIDTGDKFNMGAGTDKLVFLSGSVDFNTVNYSGLKGIDQLVLNSSAKNIVIGEAFMAATDKGTLTINYGKGIAILDTSGFTHSKYDVFLKGEGTVNLSAKNDEVKIANGTTGSIFGKDGNDVLYGSDGIDSLFGDGGADIIRGGKGADKLSGGAGNDTFVYTGMSDAGDIIADFRAGDRLDLTALFDANGLGSSTALQAIASGHLKIAKNGADITVSFDADGAAGSAHTSATLVTLKDAALPDHTALIV